MNLHTLAEHQPDLVLPGVQRVAVRFIAAQSVVDVIWELIELYGHLEVEGPIRYILYRCIGYIDYIEYILSIIYMYHAVSCKCMIIYV